MTTLRYEVRSGSLDGRYVESAHRKIAKALDDLSNHAGAQIVVRGSREDLRSIGAHMTDDGLKVELLSGVYAVEIQDV